MDTLRHQMSFAGVHLVYDATDQPGGYVFDNPDPRAGDPTYLFLRGIGLLVLAIAGFIVAISTRHGQMSLHLMSTLPTIIAVALLARAYSLRGLPRRIVVGPDAIEISTKQSTGRYPWSEIGSAATANVLNSQKSCLCITDTAGKTIIRVDESFPEFQRLVKLVESCIDAKPDDTSSQIMSRKARWMGLLCFVFGCFLSSAAVFIALETRKDQRAADLLAANGVPGEGEIVRRFVAPNGWTKRLEFRVRGSSIKNVEVDQFSGTNSSMPRRCP